jgi:hypothetical protein
MWAWKIMALGYIISLCGEECMVRYAAGTETLEDLERQKPNQICATVSPSWVCARRTKGVDIFYEMLSARVLGYIDTSRNPRVLGAKSTRA